MSTAINYFPGDGTTESNNGGEKKEQKEDVQISPPHIERAEGPFKHSGETSGWTKEEMIEKEIEQQDDPEQP
jgi:hypothetical protein